MGYRGSLIICLGTEAEWATGGSSGATAGSKSSKRVRYSALLESQRCGVYQPNLPKMELCKIDEIIWSLYQI